MLFSPVYIASDLRPLVSLRSTSPVFLLTDHSPLITAHYCFKSFSCNTYGSPCKCCKQKTYGPAKPFRCNTYKKHGVGLRVMVNQESDKDSCPERAQRVEGPLRVSHNDSCPERPLFPGAVEGSGAAGSLLHSMRRALRIPGEPAKVTFPGISLPQVTEHGPRFSVAHYLSPVQSLRFRLREK